MIRPYLSRDPDFYEIGGFLEKLLKHAFAGRRKKLRNTIGSFVTSNDQIKEFFDSRGISLEQRPQEISPSNWFALAKALKEIKVCIDYDKDQLPIYKSFSGWMQDTSNARSFDDLPKAAQEYILFIEETLDCPIGIVSVSIRER